MIGKNLWNKILTIAMAVSFLIMASCGTILYPERRGQTEGRLDPGVIMLDGALLLIGIVPGVVAFAVDYATGSIYLPPEGPGSTRRPEPGARMRVIYTGEKPLTRSHIATVLEEETGKRVDLAQVRWLQPCGARQK